MRLWDATTGKLIREMKGHSDNVPAAVFSPDGRYIASGSWDTTVRLWDGETGAPIKKLGEQNSRIQSLAFNRDGRRLVTGIGGKGAGGFDSVVFAVPSGEVVSRFSKHDNTVGATAISPDGRTAATGGGSIFPIYLWEIESGDAVRSLAGEGRRVWSVAFAEDSGSIAFGKEYSYRSPNNLGPLQRAITLRRDGAYRVALGDDVRDESRFLRARDVHGDLSLGTRQDPEGFETYLQIVRADGFYLEIWRDPPYGFQHRCFSFTPDGDQIVSGYANGHLPSYSVESGEEVHDFVGHTSGVLAVAVSPDGKTLVSGSSDQTVRLWDMATGDNLLTVFVGADEEWVAWTPQGYYASSPNGDKYIGWHINRGVDKLAEYYGAAQYEKTFYRPDVVAEFLEVRDIDRALERANAARPGPSRPPPLVTSSQITSYAPPVLFFGSPREAETQVNDAGLRVEGEARSTSLPLTAVTLLLNGRPIQEYKPQGQRHAFDFEVDLEPGRNVLIAIAEHDAARSDFESRIINFGDAVAPEASPKPDLYLLAIGVSDYEDDSFDLDYAHRDAEAIEKIFLSQQGGAFREVHAKALISPQATRSRILKELNWLRDEGTPQDLRVLFLSGHGGMDPQNQYYFFAHAHDKSDFEAEDVAWRTMLGRLAGAQSKAILLVDTCHAGGATGSKKKGEDDFEKIIKDIQTEHSGIASFASSTHNEKSEELPPPHNHGAFTYALLEGLCGLADKLPSDGQINTAELAPWIHSRVLELTEQRQRSTRGLSNGLKDFSFFHVRETDPVCASLR